METYKCTHCGEKWVVEKPSSLPPEKLNECRQGIQHQIINVKSIIKTRKVISV